MRILALLAVCAVALSAQSQFPPAYVPGHQEYFSDVGVSVFKEGAINENTFGFTLANDGNGYASHGYWFLNSDSGVFQDLFYTGTQVVLNGSFIADQVYYIKSVSGSVEANEFALRPHLITLRSGSAFCWNDVDDAGGHGSVMLVNPDLCLRHPLPGTLSIETGQLGTGASLQAGNLTLSSLTANTVLFNIAGLVSGDSGFQYSPALSTPAAPSVSNGGEPGAEPYGYKIVARDAMGTTLASPEGATATGNAVLDGTNFNRLSWTSISGAASYDVYLSTGGGNTPTVGFLANVPTTSYDHIGQDGDSATAPSVNTTAGLYLNTSLRVAPHTPSSSSEPCTQGQSADGVDSGTYYHYACVAANTWVRVAYSAF